MSDTAGGSPRLSARTVARVRHARLPSYDRSASPCIVHLGVGAFARAHLGSYTDDLLRAGWPATVRGVSLRSGRAEDQLGPQDGLYTIGRAGDGQEDALRIVGALTSVRTGVAAAVQALAAPATTFVTLTVTEKGYEPDPRDAADPQQPWSAPAVVALGLARRRDAKAPTPVIASLDNLTGNGSLLRAQVLVAAERLRADLPEWIVRNVPFVESVVDRMVPATTEAGLDAIASRIGVRDLAAVTTERYRSWVVTAADGLPPLGDVGVEVVSDIAPYERRKLWLLNGPHSALAYLGLVTGCSTIAAAVDQDQVGPYVRRLVEEILQVTDLPSALHPQAFVDETLRRFRNAHLGHTCAQVGADGSRKLPQRLLPVVAARHRQGLPTDRFAVVVAAWLCAVAGLHVPDGDLPALDDPAAGTLRAAARQGGPVAVSRAALGEHDDDGRFSRQVVERNRPAAAPGRSCAAGERMTTTLGGPAGLLSPEAIGSFIRDQFAQLNLDGRSLCVVIPDATRRCPLPLLLGAITHAVTGRVRSCQAVVALGTHPPMPDDALAGLVGDSDIPVVNHAWWDPAALVTVGRLGADQVAQLSGERLHEGVDVRVNRHVVDSDVTVIVGPVLPHEVVGFSGGNKYLFPGLSGAELIDLTHWLGALITSREIIGTLGVTPVRALIDAAAELVPGERHALCVVTDHESDGLHSLAFGTPTEAWAAAAEAAAKTHVTYLSAPVPRVLSLVAPRYTDIWTGAKGFYKVEPVVADGGEVVLYAPHITELAPSHPGLADLGYHCRDYFLAHWDRYQSVPRGELAHSTHLFGAGTYDPVRGEQARVRVTLATGISESVVRRANLGYLDPADVDVNAATQDIGTLVVPDAGEVLFRLSRDRS